VQCPFCGGDSTVSETRAAGHALRRRRVCGSCKQRFTTFENVAPPAIRIEKRDGAHEPYDRAKLRRALVRVCKHRPLDGDAIDNLVERIEAELARSPAKLVRWSRLTELVLDALRATDRLAEQRMAANYIDDAGALRFEDAPSPDESRPQLGLFSDE
jgi:transcriptional repressor NrdR